MQAIRNSQDVKGSHPPRGGNVGGGQNGGRYNTRLPWKTTKTLADLLLLTNPNLEGAGEIQGVFHEGVNYGKL